MFVDGVHKPLRDARYLLSPGDLYALPEIPRLLPLGISSFKIEGRYKDADYVALTTAAYRKAVDEAWAGLPLSHGERERLQLEQVYSRGLGPWFISGTNHQQVVNGRAPRHRGVRMGQVVQVGVSAVFIEPSPEQSITPLKPGDGVVFDAADRRSPQEKEEGGRVYQVHARDRGRLEVRFANGAIDFQRVRNGDWLWRSDDPDIERAARPYKEAAQPLRRQPVNLHLRARVGEPLRLTAALASAPGMRVSMALKEPLAVAQRQPPSEAALREQLARLGGTVYEPADVRVEIEGAPFVPNSVLNGLRRAVMDALALRQQGQGTGEREEGRGERRERRERREGREPDVDQTLFPIPYSLSPALHLLVRGPEQLEAALVLPEKPASITLDYLELYGLQPVVERVRAAGIVARVASPRVLKPNDERVVNFLRTLNCELLVRSSGLLHSLIADERESTGSPAVSGDFSLNTANALSVQAYFDAGIGRLTPSYDLNAAQLTELVKVLDAGRFEVVAYMHLPVFHTEHCVFCRFLSDGTSYKDCGHPCEKHRVTLRDEKGHQHAVLADVGCRNTVFGAQAQEISAHLDAVRRAGVRHFRLEFVHETADQLTRVTQAFQDALAGRISAAVLSARLAAAAPDGVTQGSFFISQ
jgi:putative protease